MKWSRDGGHVDHDDVIKWKHFQHYWSFMRGIHWNPMTRSLDVFFDVRLNKQLSEKSRFWWFGTPWRSLWRRCNAQFWYFLSFSESSKYYFRNLNNCALTAFSGLGWAVRAASVSTFFISCARTSNGHHVQNISLSALQPVGLLCLENCWKRAPVIGTNSSAAMTPAKYQRDSNDLTGVATRTKYEYL